MSNDNNKKPELPKMNVKREVSRLMADFFSQSIDQAEKSKHSDFFKTLYEKDTQLLELYLAQGINPDQLSSGGETALHVAARLNNTAAIDVLLQHKADPTLKSMNEREETALETAVRCNCPASVTALVKTGAYPEAQEGNWTLFHRLCETNKTEMLPALLDAGADPNEKTASGATPLLIAVMRKNGAVADVLLDLPAVAEGMNIHSFESDSTQRKAFQFAVERGQHATVKKMIVKGALPNTPDADGTTPLLAAIATYDVPMIRLLLEEGGVDVNFSPEDKTPPLFTAIAYSKNGKRETQAADMVEALIRFGADPDLKDKKTGQTALHYAIEQGGEGLLLDVLLRHPVRIDEKDKSGRSPLFLAITRKSAAMMKKLVQGGANIDQRRPEDGATPLISAVRNKHFVQAEWLIRNGANTTLADKHVKAPYDYAIASDDRLIKTLFTAPPAARVPPSIAAFKRPNFKGPEA